MNCVFIINPDDPKKVKCVRSSCTNWMYLVEGLPLSLYEAECMALKYDPTTGNLLRVGTSLVDECPPLQDCSGTQARIVLSGFEVDALGCGAECLDWNDTYVLSYGGTALLTDDGACLAGAPVDLIDADVACQWSLSIPRCSYTYTMELAVWGFFGTGWLSMFGVRSPGSYDSGSPSFADEVILYVADDDGNLLVEGDGQLLNFAYTFIEPNDLCGVGGSGQLECTINPATFGAVASIELVP